MVQLLLLGVTIVATQHLSVAAFGTYALASLFLILTRALFYVGPYEYQLKAQPEQGLSSACFWANIALACFSSLCLAAVYFIAPHVFATRDVSMLVALLTPSLFLIAATSWYEALLLRSMRVRRYYLSTLLGDTAGAAVAVVLLLDGLGVTSLVVQNYVRLFVLLTIYVFSLPERPKLRVRVKQVWDVLRWSRARYAAVLLNFTSAYGADIVLGALLSPAATGFYRASSRIVSSLTDLFAQPLQKIAQTNLSARYVRSLEMGTSWLTMLSGVGTVAWASLLTLAFLAEDIVPFVLGDKWAPAVPIVIVFCIVKCFSLLDAVTTAFLVCHDRQATMLRVQVCVAVSVVVLAVVCAPLGATAVAAAVGVACVSMSVIYGAMVIRLSRASRDALADFARTSLPPILSVALGLMLLDMLHPQLQGLEAIAVGGGVAGFAFALGMFSVRYRMLTAIGSLGHVVQGGQA